MPAMIVAYDRQRGIGKGKEQLWRPYEMASDKERFRMISREMGTIIVGSNSLIDEQIDLIQRPFPKVDQVIMLSRRDKSEFTIPDIDIAHSMEEALEMARHDPLIIGGAQVYRAGLPYADRIYATEIDADLPHDEATRFPELLPDQWRETERTFVPAGKLNDDTESKKQNIYPSYEVTYERIARS